jgi:hypothetical protein
MSWKLINQKTIGLVVFIRLIEKWDGFFILKVVLLQVNNETFYDNFTN